MTDRLDNFGTEAADVWARAMDGMAPGMKARLADHLDEIVLNALGHANSPVGCLVAGQAFPRTDRVEVAVVDLGQTIRGHLTRNPRYRDIGSDEQAILLATEETVTGTIGRNAIGEINSGAGLHELRLFCESGGGEMTILSGDCYITFSPSGLQTTAFHGRFQGCLVNLRFFTDPALPSTEPEEIIF